MQAAHVLVRDDFRDDPDVTSMSKRVGHYKDLFKTAASDPKVTIVESANDCLIVDGNKSAIAAFLHASENEASHFNLTMYCVHASSQIFFMARALQGSRIDDLPAWGSNRGRTPEADEEKARTEENPPEIGGL
jgi:hypothetical protein